MTGGEVEQPTAAAGSSGSTGGGDDVAGEGLTSTSVSAVEEHKCPECGNSVRADRLHAHLYTHALSALRCRHVGQHKEATSLSSSSSFSRRINSSDGKCSTGGSSSKAVSRWSSVPLRQSNQLGKTPSVSSSLSSAAPSTSLGTTLRKGASSNGGNKEVNHRPLSTGLNKKNATSGANFVDAGSYGAGSTSSPHRIERTLSLGSALSKGQGSTRRISHSNATDGINSRDGSGSSTSRSVSIKSKGASLKKNSQKHLTVCAKDSTSHVSAEIPSSATSPSIVEDDVRPDNVKSNALTSSSSASSSSSSSVTPQTSRIIMSQQFPVPAELDEKMNNQRQGISKAVTTTVPVSISLAMPVNLSASTDKSSKAKREAKRELNSCASAPGMTGAEVNDLADTGLTEGNGTKKSQECIPASDSTLWKSTSSSISRHSTFSLDLSAIVKKASLGKNDEVDEDDDNRSINTARHAARDKELAAFSRSTMTARTPRNRKVEATAPTPPPLSSSHSSSISQNDGAGVTSSVSRSTTAAAISTPRRPSHLQRTPVTSSPSSSLSFLSPSDSSSQVCNTIDGSTLPSKNQEGERKQTRTIRPTSAAARCYLAAITRLSLSGVTAEDCGSSRARSESHCEHSMAEGGNPSNNVPLSGGLTVRFCVGNGNSAGQESKSVKSFGSRGKEVQRIIESSESNDSDICTRDSEKISNTKSIVDPGETEQYELCDMKDGVHAAEVSSHPSEERGHKRSLTKSSAKQEDGVVSGTSMDVCACETSIDEGGSVDFQSQVKRQSIIDETTIFKKLNRSESGGKKLKHVEENGNSGDSHATSIRSACRAAAVAAAAFLGVSLPLQSSVADDPSESHILSSPLVSCRSSLTGSTLASSSGGESRTGCYEENDSGDSDDYSMSLPSARTISTSSSQNDSDEKSFKSSSTTTGDERPHQSNHFTEEERIGDNSLLCSQLSNVSLAIPSHDQECSLSESSANQNLVANEDVFPETIVQDPAVAQEVAAADTSAARLMESASSESQGTEMSRDNPESTPGRLHNLFAKVESSTRDCGDRRQSTSAIRQQRQRVLDMNSSITLTGPITSRSNNRVGQNGSEVPSEDVHMQQMLWYLEDLEREPAASSSCRDPLRQREGVNGPVPSTAPASVRRSAARQCVATRQSNCPFTTSAGAANAAERRVGEPGDGVEGGTTLSPPSGRSRVSNTSSHGSRSNQSGCMTERSHQSSTVASRNRHARHDPMSTPSHRTSIPLDWLLHHGSASLSTSESSSASSSNSPSQASCLSHTPHSASFEWWGGLGSNSPTGSSISPSPRHSSYRHSGSLGSGSVPLTDRQHGSHRHRMVQPVAGNWVPTWAHLLVNTDFSSSATPNIPRCTHGAGSSSGGTSTSRSTAASTESLLSSSITARSTRSGSEEGDELGPSEHPTADIPLPSSGQTSCSRASARVSYASTASASSATTSNSSLSRLSRSSLEIVIPRLEIDGASTSGTFDRSLRSERRAMTSRAHYSPGSSLLAEEIDTPPMSASYSRRSAEISDHHVSSGREPPTSTARSQFTHHGSQHYARGDQRYRGSYGRTHVAAGRPSLGDTGMMAAVAAAPLSSRASYDSRNYSHRNQPSYYDSHGHVYSLSSRRAAQQRQHTPFAHQYEGQNQSQLPHYRHQPVRHYTSVAGFPGHIVEARGPHMGAHHHLHLAEYEQFIHLHEEANPPRRGLTQAQLDNFPLSGFDTRKSGGLCEDAKHCSICFEDYDDNATLRRLPCTHVFHQDCIDCWLAQSTQCPICKFDLVE